MPTLTQPDNSKQDVFSQWPTGHDMQLCHIRIINHCFYTCFHFFY